MENNIDYDLVKSSLHKLNTDETISSAHGILCGFACVKPDLQLDDWLNEVLINVDLANVKQKSSFEHFLSKVFASSDCRMARNHFGNMLKV